MSLNFRVIMLILVTGGVIFLGFYWFININGKNVSPALIEEQLIAKPTILEPIDLKLNHKLPSFGITKQERLAMFHDSERKISKSVLEDFLRISKISNEKLYGIDGDTLTQAEAREILSYKVAQNRAIRASWNESRGISYSKNRLYEDYDEETLRSLAIQGDIYALQALANIASLKNNHKRSSQLLFTAAVEGSVGALFEQGRDIMLSLGQDDLDVVAKSFRLSHPPGKAKEALAMLAAAYYTVGQFRGNVRKGDIRKELLGERLGRNFTVKEERNIANLSQTIYQELSKFREKRGLPVFDNSYLPDNQIGTLPQENNFMEKYFNSFND